MTFQRARTKEQIERRKEEILVAASTIYNEVGYEGLNFSSISEYTKMTRPSIYKYFNTKEEILLILLKKDLISYIASLINSFTLNRLYSLKEITNIWTNNLMEHQRLLQLYSILYTIIEKNVSVESLAAFKKDILTSQSSLFHLVSQLFPRSEKKQIENFLYTQLILAFGLYPMSKLSKIQLTAIELADVDYTPPDFQTYYSEYFYQIIYCLENSITIQNEQD